jgi:hypothetical protein
MSASKPAFRELGERLAREQDELLAHPLAAAEVTLRAPARMERRRGTVRLRIGAALVASFALVALVAGVAVRARPLEVVLSPPTAASGGWISAPVDTPVSLRFSEGTEVTLAPETHARVAEVTRRGAHVLIESGAAQVSVTPGRGGQWTFTAGPFQVEVKGTRFAVAWSPREQLFTLKLVEGSVFISGCALGEGRPLFAGESVSASCLTREFHIDGAARREGQGERGTTDGAPAGSPPPSEQPPAPVTAPSAPAPGLDPDESATRPAPAAPPRAGFGRPTRATEGADGTWQSLAHASRFKEAFARVTERGFDAELGRAGSDDLLLLGDVARLSGDSARALLAYQRVRSRAAGSEAAANAAFAMGRVCFDQREAYADAAQWFSTYRKERSEGPLARDATGRQMEALSRAGDTGGAARVAEEYLRRYPQGPHAPLARTLHPR